MGADGGVLWIECRSEEKARRARELLAPWAGTLFWIGNSTNDNTRWEWVIANQRPECLYGSHGTDLFDDWAYLDDVPEFMGWLVEEITNPTYGLDESSTFQDFYDEVCTRPGWVGTGAEGCVMGATLVERWQGYDKRDYPKPEAKAAAQALLGVKIVDWLAELVECIDSNPHWVDRRSTGPELLPKWTWEIIVHNVETWT